MKRLIGLLSLILLAISTTNVFATTTLPTIPSDFSTPFMGESDFIRGSETAHVDWIVSATDMAASGTTFQFVEGNSGSYANSAYFYFYQVENTTLSSISNFAINLEPDTILSAGWLTSEDIDSSPFNHTVSLEDESASGTFNPSLGTFNNASTTPNMAWTFTVTGDPDSGLAPGDSSSILFFTSNEPPVYSDAILLSGFPAYSSTVPAPSSVPVPEPSAMIMVGWGIVAFFARKKYKKA